MNDVLDNMIISSQGGKNTTIEVVGAPTEPPEDYYTGEWILAGAKKAAKKKQKKENFEKEKKKLEFQKIKEKKLEERKNAKLWYNESSWQHKLITNCFTFKDGSNLIFKYNLQELKQEYESAKSNYRKNGVITKMLRIVTKDTWLSIKDNVIDSTKAEEAIEAEVQEAKEDVVQEAVVQEVPVE